MQIEGNVKQLIDTGQYGTFGVEVKCVHISMTLCISSLLKNPSATDN